MHIADLLTLYSQKYTQKITKSDVRKALDTVSVLGAGCRIVKDNYVCTLPYELSEDSTEVIAMADQQGFVSHKMLGHWGKDRFGIIIHKMVQEGLVWVDTKSKKDEILYFFPGNIN
jgi:hypothetical protein